MAYLAANATLLKKQNPEALSLSARCPGGRMTANPLRHSLLRMLSTTCKEEPADSSAASYVSGQKKTESYCRSNAVRIDCFFAEVADSLST